MQFRVPVPSSEYPVSLWNATSRNNGRARPNMCRFHGIIISRGIPYNVSDHYPMYERSILHEPSVLQQYAEYRFYYVFFIIFFNIDFITRNLCIYARLIYQVSIQYCIRSAKGMSHIKIEAPNITRGLSCMD